MKTLYLIGGPMGVGKTVTGRILENMLDDCFYLDGDWCWDMHPFRVTDDTKRMVMENICFMLKNFLECPSCKSVVFCWVMHEQTILDEILSRIVSRDVRIVKISLICRPEILQERLQNDINAGIREADVVERSLARLPFYRHLDTVKIDTSDMTAVQAADFISRL